MLRLAWVLVLAFVLGAERAQATPPVEDYGKLPAVTDVSMSPSGDRYAYVADTANGRNLMLMSVDGKPLAQVGIGKVKVRDVQWAGDDHVLIFFTGTASMSMEFSVERAELEAVSAFSLTSHRLVGIFANTTKVSHPVMGYYGTAEIAGKSYGYFGGFTFDSNLAGRLLHSGIPDLYRVELDSGNETLVSEGAEQLDGWLISPDGGALVAWRTYDESTGAWTVFGGGGKSLATGTDKFGGPGVWQGRTPDTVLVRRQSESGDDDYVEVSRSGGKPADMPDMTGVTGILSDPANGLWIGVIRDGDEGQVQFFDPLRNARAKAVYRAFPGLTVQLVAWSEDFAHVIAYTSGTQDPGTYYMVDLANHRAVPFGYPYPTVDTKDVGPIRMVQWKAQDGTDLHGVLSLPADRPERPLPLVVMPHGGPEDRDYPEFNWWAQAFASQGYAVFQPNFRGSSGYGVAFRNAGFGEWGRKMQTDVSDGVAYLARQGIVDPSRACVVGASYGGYVALAGVTVQQGIYRCAVSVAGLSDLTAFTDERAHAAGYGASMRYWRDFIGAHPDEISPIRFASRADAPILLIHGKDDTVVLIDQSLRMASALKAAGKPVELVIMPSEDHWLSREETRVMMLKASVAFVEKYDPLDPPPPSASAAAEPSPATH